MKTVRRERGAVIPVVALSLTVLILMTAFAVDLGRQRSSRRDMQAVADVVALDLSRLADGRSIDDIHSGNGALETDVVALASSAARNGVATANLLAEFGRWDGTTFTTYAAIDPTGAYTVNTAGTDIPNAVRVTGSEETEYFFQPGSGDVTRHAIAQFGVEPTAAFRVGSFGVAVIDEGILNSILTGVVGQPVELTALHYEGLATADVTLDELLGLIDVPDAGIPLSALSPEEALATEITLGGLYVATVAALENQGDTANAQLLQDLVEVGVPELGLTLGDLVAAETPGSDSALDAAIDVLGLVQAGALVAHCPVDTTPDDFTDDIDCSAIALPAVDAGIPGLADVGANLQVIQSPIVVAGREGTSKKTGQIQLGTDTDLGTTSLPCLPGLATLCVGGIIPADVALNLDLRVAGGPNTIEQIDCSDPSADHLLVSSVSNLVDIDLTVSTSIGVRLLGVEVATVDLQARGASVQPATSGTVQFDVPDDVFGETVRGTGQGSIGLSPLSVIVDAQVNVLPDTGIAAVLVNPLVNTLLDLITGPVVDDLVINAVVNPLLQTLDSLVLGPLTDLLGVNVVGSDLTPLQINCNELDVALVE